MTYRANEIATPATGNAGSIVEASSTRCIPRLFKFSRNERGDHRRKDCVRARAGAEGLPTSTGVTFRPTLDKGNLQ
jgi:hypothetical protein